MSSMAEIHPEGKIRPRIYCVVLSELPDVLVAIEIPQRHELKTSLCLALANIMSRVV